MEMIIIICILLNIILLITGIAIKDNDIVFGICMGIVIGLTISLITGFTLFSTIPSAIDVYRGKTTLEITYKDSVAIDSIVVFKKE